MLDYLRLDGGMFIAIAAVGKCSLHDIMGSPRSLVRALLGPF